jgi:hypothetical protein
MEASLIYRFKTSIKQNLAAGKGGEVEDQARSVQYYAKLLFVHPNHLNAGAFPRLLPKTHAPHAHRISAAIPISGAIRATPEISLINLNELTIFRESVKKENPMSFNISGLISGTILARRATCPPRRHYRQT